MTLSIYHALPLLCVLSATQALAAEVSSPHTFGGTIRFSGQIVEPVCETAPDARQQHLEMRCERDGVQSIERWPLASLAQQRVRSSLASVDLRYLDAQRRLAILNVTYE